MLRTHRYPPVQGRKGDSKASSQNTEVTSDSVKVGAGCSGSCLASPRRRSFASCNIHICTRGFDIPYFASEWLSRLSVLRHSLIWVMACERPIIGNMKAPDGHSSSNLSKEVDSANTGQLCGTATVHPGRPFQTTSRCCTYRTLDLLSARAEERVEHPVFQLCFQP